MQCDLKLLAKQLGDIKQKTIIFCQQMHVGNQFVQCDKSLFQKTMFFAKQKCKLNKESY